MPNPDSLWHKRAETLNTSDRVENIARDHDYTKVDGEVSHAVCGKTEHPRYGKKRRYDLDIALLHLCQPIMFSE